MSEKTAMRRGVKTLLILIVLAASDGLPSGLGGPGTPPESPAQVVDRAHQAHGGLWQGGEIRDAVARGQITMLGDAREPFPLTVIHKGSSKARRLVQPPGGDLVYGTDGTRSWQKSGPFTAGAAGPVRHWLESQTVRSLPRLFDYRTEGLALNDLGIQTQDLGPAPAPARVIEAQDRAGRQTRYYIDQATALVTRVEFETETFYTQLFSGEPIPVLATLVFSDYREAGGVKTPFKIDFYLGFLRIEQIELTSVQYNTGVPDADFEP